MGNSESGPVQNGGTPSTPSTPSTRSPVPAPYSSNGHSSPRKIEDDYVDLGNDQETFSKEEMEDKFLKIVVSAVANLMLHGTIEA